MVSMFVAGGFWMVPVVIVGLLSVAVGLRHASLPGRGWASSAATLRFATLAVAIAGSATDLSTVSAMAAGVEEAAIRPLLVQGLSESLAPLIFGGVLAGLSALFAAVGDLRST